EALHAGGITADRRFEEIASAVRPAPDERDAFVGVLRWTTVENVVDVAGVGLEVALESGEEALHELLVVLFGVREEYAVAVDDGREEVAYLASLTFADLVLRRLSPRGISFDRYDAGIFDGVFPHAGNDGCAQRVAGLFRVAAHGASIDFA